MLNTTTTSIPVLQACNVHKSYRRGTSTTQVLGGVNLAVARGECTFLVGPSGSGKSTLLSILGCILTPDQGQLRILGRDISQLHDRARIQVRRDVIGFVFQRFQLIRGLNVFDNVLLPLQLQGRTAPSSRTRVRELLAAVGLTDHANAKPANLSAGQCQRVAFARALANDPQIILADEPTASLDAVTGDNVMQLLRRLLNDYDKTAIIVTHDPRIFKFADRIHHLENGCLTEAERTTPNQFTDN
ncbi:MAG: ABC transporter ATP-binding protein [Pirellulaceae bacterium]